MASKVQYVASFAADTNAAEANVKRYAGQIDSANATLRAAEKAARETFQSQSQYIKATTRDQSELDKTQRAYFTSLSAIRGAAKDLGTVLVDANRGAISSENAKAEATRLTTAAIEAQTAAIRANVTAESGHKVSGQSAASGSVQLLEGRAGIRTIESFLGNTLGGAGLFSALFPVVGAIQVGKLLFEMGEKIYDVEEKARNAGKAFDEAFGELSVKARTNITDLDLQAAKIQENIDKLSGHPGNGLAVAAAEAKKAFDSLLVTLREDQKAIDAIFKASSVGTIGGILSGQKSTTQQEANLKSDAEAFQAELSRLALQRDAALANAGGDTAARKRIDDEYNRQTKQRFDDRIASYRTEVARQAKEQRDAEAAAEQPGNGVGGADGAPQAGPVTSNQNSIKELEGVLTQYTNRRDIFLGAVRNANLTEQELALKGDKERAEIAKRGAAELSAAQRRADEERKQQWQEEFSAFTAAGNTAKELEAFFWAQKKAGLQEGSRLYREADERENNAIRDVTLDTARKDKQNATILSDLGTEHDKDSLKENERGLSNSGKEALKLIPALQGVGRAQAEANLQVEEGGLRLDIAAGRISRYDAALAQASINARRFALDNAELAQRRSQVADPDSLQGKTQLAQIQQQQEALNARMTVGMFNDQAAIAAQSFAGAFGAVNDQIISSSQDTAAKLADIYGSALAGINGSIVNAVTGDASGIGGVLKGVGKQVAGFGLQKVEGSVLSGFGLGTGKPDGSRSNKFWVQMDSGSVSSLPALPSDDAIKSLAGPIASLIPGGSFITSLFGGGRAVGGPVNAGTTYLVGENGPEPFTPGTSGTITPNHTLRDALKDNSGAAYYSISMEAGVTPEQFNQGLASALRQFHPKVVNDSIKAVSEVQKRGSSRAAF